MREVNAAYAVGDEDAFRRIVMDSEYRPEAVEGSGLQSLTSRCYWLELLDAADTKYIATLIVGGKFVQIISDVSQTVDHPYDPLNFLAHFLRPPGLRPNAAS